MASGGESTRNGKPESAGARERSERDRDREREREREWVTRESAQQHQHHRERDRERDREPGPVHHPRDIVPPGGSNASLNTAPPQQPPQTPLAETGSGSFLSRIGGPYRSPPTASNSFRSDVGEQRSWPEDDWDGTRKRTASGEANLFFSFFIEVRHNADWYTEMISFRSGENLYGRCVGRRRLEFRLPSAQATTY